MQETKRFFPCKYWVPAFAGTQSVRYAHTYPASQSDLPKKRSLTAQTTRTSTPPSPNISRDTVMSSSQRDLKSSVMEDPSTTTRAMPA